ncbi:hypothetical protein EDC21_1091 [Thermohydrogenium kirishiense]|nr:hypothetical protein EDC21_1091 [Thermohydrogenium kirishiense]
MMKMEKQDKRDNRKNGLLEFVKFNEGLKEVSHPL